MGHHLGGKDACRPVTKARIWSYPESAAWGYHSNAMLQHLCFSGLPQNTNQLLVQVFMLFFFPGGKVRILKNSSAKLMYSSGTPAILMQPVLDESLLLFSPTCFCVCIFFNGCGMTLSSTSLIHKY